MTLLSEPTAAATNLTQILVFQPSPRKAPLRTLKQPQSSSLHLPSWRTNAASSLTCKYPLTLPSNPPNPYPKFREFLKLILGPFSYVPRKCSATNRIIKAKDHASVQISVGKVDENGRYTGENQTYALCGFVRAMGESDDSLNRLAQRDGFLKGVWSASR